MYGNGAYKGITHIMIILRLPILIKIKKIKKMSLYYGDSMNKINPCFNTFHRIQIFHKNVFLKINFYLLCIHF